MAKIIGNTTTTPYSRPDWLQDDATKADYIKNKPTVLTEEEVVQLISENAPETAQADWTQNDASSQDFIKNKPFENGLVDGSVQQDGDTAGALGYYYNAIDLLNKKIYLTNTQPEAPQVVIASDGDFSGFVAEGFETPRYSIGSAISLINGNKYDYGYLCGITIDAIEGNVVTYAGSLSFDAVISNDDEMLSSYFSFCVPSQLDVGVCKIRSGSIAFGEHTRALGSFSFASGKESRAVGDYGHAEGIKTRAGFGAHAEGGLRAGFDNKTLYFEEDAMPAEEDRELGVDYVVTEKTSDIEHIKMFLEKQADSTKPAPTYKFRENGVNLSDAKNHPLSRSKDVPSVIFTEARGSESHAEGASTFAGGSFSHTEGTYTRAFGQAGHAEGYYTRSVGTGAHAEGNRTLSHGGFSHAEGEFTEAMGQASHAEGTGTRTKEQGAHAEGIYTQALGMGSHVEGGYNIVPSGVQYAHAEGFLTEVGAEAHFQHVQGKANVPMGNEYAHVVGWGDTANNKETQLPEATERKNIHTLKTTGEAWYAGDVYVGADDAKEKLIKQSQLDSAVTQVNNDIISATTSINNRLDTEVDTLNAKIPSLKKGSVDNSIVHASSGYAGARTIKLSAVEKVQADPVKYVLKVPKSYFTIGDNNKITPDPTTSSIFKNVAVILKNAMYFPNSKITGAVTITGYSIDDDYVALSYNNYFGFEKTSYTWEEGTSFVVLNYTITNFDALTETTENPIGILGLYAFSEGLRDAAIGNYSHAEGADSLAPGYASHAEGGQSVASGQNSHAEGSTTLSSGSASHAEGNKTIASGYCAHSEGLSTTALGSQSHAEGHTTQANGAYAHAEGYLTEANANGSHVGGWGAKANKTGSFAHGNFVTANTDYQVVFGKYNIVDNSKKYAQIVGWGDATTPKNIYTLDTFGNAEFSGNVTANGEKLITATEATAIAAEEATKAMGNMSAALDAIIAYQEATIATQNALIGGES